MKFPILGLAIICIALFANGKENCQSLKQSPKSILIFSKTNGHRHESIPAGLEALRKIAKQNNYHIEATEDSTSFNHANLARFHAIILLQCTGNVFGEKEQEALQNFVHKGGGIVGIHAASDCEPNWPWYIQMIGGKFQNHPAKQNAKLLVSNKRHPSTKMLPSEWIRFDEWYNFSDLNPNVKVLISIDENSYTGGKHGKNHPMCWYHNFEGARVFYTELGHTIESYSEPLFLQHITGGITYALGKN